MLVGETAGDGDDDADGIAERVNDVSAEVVSDRAGLRDADAQPLEEDDVRGDALTDTDGDVEREMTDEALAEAEPRIEADPCIERLDVMLRLGEPLLDGDGEDDGHAVVLLDMRGDTVNVHPPENVVALVVAERTLLPLMMAEALAAREAEAQPDAVGLRDGETDADGDRV